MRYIILGYVFLLFFSPTFTDASQILKVGTIERPPFSYKQEGEWKGFSIDLWKNIAQNNNFLYEFVEYKEFAKMITATQQKQNDLSIANISITLERETFLDFSQPIFDSGLNVLSIKGIIDQHLYFSPLLDNIGKIFFSILFLFIGITHFLWVFNIVRGNISVWTYFSEIVSISFEVLYQIKNQYGTKILLGSSLIGAVFVTSYFSQKVSYIFASYDENYVKNEISEYVNIEPSDFSELQIGVTEGSTSLAYLNKRNIPAKTYKLFEQMPEDLRKGNIDIVIHDDPILRYFSENRGKGKFTLVGKVFQSEKFAIAFPENSHLIEKVDQTILLLKESGVYGAVYEMYF